MKTFKELRTESTDISKLGAEKHMAKLDRTRQSIITHKRYGGQLNHRRGYDLVDRYNAHADALKQHHPEHWKEYNKKHGSDKSHDGYDLYA